MMDELKKNQLAETEMESVSGGTSRFDFLNNAVEEKIFLSLTIQERNVVLEQPDRASKRAKMNEFYTGKAHIDRSSASGSW